MPTEWQAVARVLDEQRTTRGSLTKLASLGVVELEDRFLDELTDAGAISDGSDTVTAAPDAAPQLTPEQLAAVDLGESAPADSPATALVGITGSGKTEVYLELLRRTVEAGKGAIVLVPEIALTPQTARRFVRRFPGQVEVLHSAMTKAKRHAAWLRIARGESTIVVGPRSAIFAPIANLGAIFVDEEHDGSYKQESEPRYDARRVAWQRARLQGARVIYGSATPRPETWHGIARRALMLTRPTGGRLAPIQFVDLRQESDDYPLTRPLLHEIEQTLSRDRKIIVLHNRRGYATALHCRTCGGSFQCDRCDVALVVHGRNAKTQRLTCHHCGFDEPVPPQCPECGAADIARMGAGTERLDRDLADRLDVPVLRLDADTTNAGRDVAGLLESFRGITGGAVLVGTQMVAKGHDFPDVELAVVIDADTSFAIPDFRAEERAFSLVSQLAGRAGRSAETAAHGRVVVQSWNVDRPLLRFAANHDVEGFLTSELAERERHGWPPYTRLVRVLLSAPHAADVRLWADAVKHGLAALEAGEVLGPARLLRVADRERSQLLLRTTQVPGVAAAMRQFLRRTQADRSKRDVRIILDVDPQTVV
jgi:primosomal protein N' (replication factor Y)